MLNPSNNNILWLHHSDDGYETNDISELMIMKSAAGFYMGRWCRTKKTETEDDTWVYEPYSRHSIYFETEEECGRQYWHAKQGQKEGSLY